ncbi:MAG: DUF3570 domain-containing protein [Lautropia sp.]
MQLASLPTAEAASTPATASRHRRIGTALACAAAGLLGSGCTMLERVTPGPEWKTDAAVLAYSEADRVSVLEAAVSATRETEAGSRFALKGVFDSLTGASATGAVPSTRPQTFTRPSGNGSYTVKPGEVPLDDTFKDTRVALSADWEADVRRGLRYGLGLNVSSEYDYRSVGLSGRLLKDLNERNTTLSAALSIANDSINPVGGVPTGLSRMDAGDRGLRASSDTKSVVDLLLGATQLIDDRSFFQVNYGLTRSSGYHTDPYKYVSLVDANGEPFEAGGAIPSVIHEQRPDARTRHAFFARYKRRLRSESIVDLSYRFTVDDWGIDTHAIEGKYRFALGGDNNYLQPRLRLDRQSAADFYRGFLRQGEALPSTVSADYRLAAMTTITVGLEYGWGRPASPWRIAFDYYMQRPSEPDGKFGQLLSQRLAPNVNAVMFRLNKTF